MVAWLGIGGGIGGRALAAQALHKVYPLGAAASAGTTLILVTSDIKKGPHGTMEED